MRANGHPTADTEQQRQRRARMVRSQIERRGIADPRVLDAMLRVPRHRFVAEGHVEDAYSDHPLPIGEGQTISQPFTVAFMAEAARIHPSDHVLEVGTGSGYGAAVLSHLAAHVDTIERLPALAEQARQRLAALGYENVRVHLANGTLGLPEAGPFDAILVTAGAIELPRPYVKQLNEGGRIVIPVGPELHVQTMYRFTLHHGKLLKENLGGFQFVPLIGDYGWRG